MANCYNCGAPLAPKTIICPYCKSRNDIDLKGIHKHTVEEIESERICPRCTKPLQTIDLKLEGKFFIERCTHCLGLFFDPGELEALLDKSVSNVYVIDRQQLENINKVKRHDDYPVTYIKCPVCQKLMNRINFGAQSGVIIDNCREHGIWLDGGELRQLMEWTKAGGQMLHQQKQVEIERMKKQAAQQNRTQTSTAAGGPISLDLPDSRGFGGYSEGGFGDAVDLLGLLTRTVTRFFRF
jgi:Zn-finger nucleic acid-binding protein